MCANQKNISEPIIAELSQLNEFLKDHLFIGKKMIEAYEGSIYPLDLLAVATLNRSLKNIKGFILLIESKNIICAGSLLRLQIDSCIRFFSSFLVKDPHSLAVKVLEGEKINKLRDRDGNKMSDSYLVQKISVFAPWIMNVYKETSGYIHLSMKHYFNCIRTTDEDKVIEFHITEKDQFIPDSIYIEAIQAFKSATDLLFYFLNGWIVSKDNPKLIDEIRNAFINKYGREPDVFDKIKIDKV